MILLVLGLMVLAVPVAVLIFIGWKQTRGE